MLLPSEPAPHSQGCEVRAFLGYLDTATTEMFPSVGAKQTTWRAPRRIVQTFRNSKIRRKFGICIELNRWRITPFVDVDLKEGKCNGPAQTKQLAFAAPAGLLWTAIRSATQWNSPVRTAVRRARKTPGASARSIILQMAFFRTYKARPPSASACNGSLRIVPVVMLHDQDETGASKRFSRRTWQRFL